MIWKKQLCSGKHYNIMFGFAVRWTVCNELTGGSCALHCITVLHCTAGHCTLLHCTARPCNAKLNKLVELVLQRNAMQCKDMLTSNGKHNVCVEAKFKKVNGYYLQFQTLISRIFWVYKMYNYHIRIFYSINLFSKFFLTATINILKCWSLSEFIDC